MKNSEKVFKTSSAMRNNALRGLALVQKYKRSVPPEDLAYARTIVSGDQTLSEIKSGYVHLTKDLGTLPKTVEDGGPPDEKLIELLFGGSAGLANYRQVLKSEGILKSMKRDITPAELEKEEPTELAGVPIVKSQNVELQQATYVVLQPEQVDLHGDIYSAEEVQKACFNFNKSAAKANLFHLIETDGFHVAESYIAPTEMILGDVHVTKGTWLATLQFTDETLWQGVKDGLFSGVSIGAMGFAQPLNETENAPS